MEELTVKISEIEHLLEEYDVEIESPDGFVPVTQFVDKGVWEEWVLSDDEGNTVRVNQNHLFETQDGWKFVSELKPVDMVLKDDGNYHYVSAERTGFKIPIVDLSINHPNHRYYANGFSSHNTNAGKSHFLCHHASFCLRSNLNVLYVTCEMSENKIAERIDANIMDTDLNKLRDLPKDIYTRKFEEKTKNIQGRLIIKEYPTATCNVNHLRSLLNELRIKKKFVPDIIFIDYLSIMISSRVRGDANTYVIGKAIAEEVRGLAIEYDVPIWSAVQFNRSGASDNDPELTQISESYGIAFTADLSLAMTRSDKMDEMGVMMMKQLKNRYSDISVNRKFLVGVERSKMRIMNTTKKLVANSDNGASETEDESIQQNTQVKTVRNRNKAIKTDTYSSWNI